MPLECVMFCIDTSNYMRNGDLHPTRLVAQQQTISALTQYKLDDNAESAIGLLTMAGRKVDVQISPSRENHKLLNSLKVLKPQGEIDIQSSLRISQLILRNRPNPHQRQRIVMFIGSPICLSDQDILQSGKELKKNGIALDIVLFGHESLENGNVEKAKKLIDSTQSSNNSRLVIHYDPALIDLDTLPVEVQALIPLNSTNSTLSEVVLRSPIGRNIQPAAPRPAAPVAVQQQQPAAAAAAAVTNIGATNRGPAAQPGTDVTVMGDDDDGEMDADLLAAIAMSMGVDESGAVEDTVKPLPLDDIDNAEMDADLLAAIAMSMEVGDESTATTAKNDQTQDTQATKEDGKEEEEEEEEMDADLLAAIQFSLEQEGAQDKKKDDDEEDFNALLEAVSGGAVTKEDDKEKEKKD